MELLRPCGEQSWDFGVLLGKDLGMPWTDDTAGDFEGYE